MQTIKLGVKQHYWFIIVLEWRVYFVVNGARKKLANSIFCELFCLSSLPHPQAK